MLMLTLVAPKRTAALMPAFYYEPNAIWTSASYDTSEGAQNDAAHGAQGAHSVALSPTALPQALHSPDGPTLDTCLHGALDAHADDLFSARADYSWGGAPNTHANFQRRDSTR